MSTQRRANRTSPAITNDCAGVWFRWFRGCMEHAGTSVSAAQTGSTLTSTPSRQDRSVAGTKAPLMSIVWLAWAWLFSGDDSSRESTERVATHSLPSDTCFETFAGLGSLSGSPPREGAGDRRLTVPQATHMSSPRHIPTIPVRARLQTTLPQAPAGLVRWAERHDGKRDLYFQHAA